MWHICRCVCESSIPFISFLLIQFSCDYHFLSHNLTRLYRYERRQLLSHRNGSTCELSYSDNNHTLNFQGIILPQRVRAFLLCSTSGLKDHRVPLSCTQYHSFKISITLFDSYNILTWYLQDKLLGIGRSSVGLCRFYINHLSRLANPYIYNSVEQRIFTIITYNLHHCLNILFECPSVISLSTINPSHTSGSYILDRILYASIRQVQYNTILWASVDSFNFL